MKKLLGLQVLTASIFAFTVLFTSCATVGVVTSGGKYFDGKKEEELVKYFKYEGEVIKASSDYDRVLYFTNLVSTLYMDKTTVEKFKNKRSQEIAKLEYYTLSDGCQYWTESTNFNYFGIDATRKSYAHDGVLNNNSQIKQGLNNYYTIIKKLNAVENTVQNQQKIKQLIENTEIGKSFYLWEIRNFTFGQYMDNYHNEYTGTATDYSIIKVDVYEDSKSSTETHTAYIYNDREKSYTDEKGNAITKETALQNEKSYISKGFASRKKNKGLALTAYIKDGVVVKVETVE